MEESKLGIWLEKALPEIFLFVIRIVETFAASIVPSILSVIVIFFSPSENAWSVLSIFTFIITIAVNWYFWLDFVAERESVKKFYIVNGIVYAIYAAASIAGYFFLGYLVYSMSFANLRMFEVFDERVFKEFHISTLQSIIITNILTVVIMIICERWSRFHIDKIKAFFAANGADKVEMTFEEEVLPTKSNEVVTPLSVEEMENQIKKDEEERLEVAKMVNEKEPEQLWNENISKGRGETIERVDYTKEGTDLDETDFNPTKEHNDNTDYDSDSLWNKEIYRGRTADGKPITDFGYEENEVLPQEDDEPIWNKDFYKGKDKEQTLSNLEKMYEHEEDEYKEAVKNKVPYGAESLWEKDFYKGRNKDHIPDKVLDFDDEIEKRPETETDRYDVDSLWDNIKKGKADPEVEPEQESPINPNIDYDADSLWDKNMYRGRKTK